MEIDWTKPIETTDGNPCVYLGEFGDGHMWVAYSSDAQRSWGTIKVFPNGYVPHLDFRIRNVSEKRRLEGWLNVYAPDDAFYYGSRTEANISADSHRIACIKIDQNYTVGEGLE